VSDDQIVTPRLRLIPLGPRDVDVVLSHWNRPEINGPLWHGDRLSTEYVEEQLEISAIDFESDGFGLWRIEAGDVPCLGIVGLRQATWRNGIELVFSVEQSWWGHGYATEAVKAVLSRALVEVELREVVAVVPVNARGPLRVVRKAGMRPVGEAQIGPDRMAVFVVRHPIR
jgi:RimJ/RimL family protein N-acetyltransferase